MSPPIEDRIEQARNLEERIRRAQSHVEFGRSFIEYNKELLEKYRSDGRDTKPVEDLLATLERTQKVFEFDLADLERRRGLV